MSEQREQRKCDEAPGKKPKPVPPELGLQLLRQGIGNAEEAAPHWRHLQCVLPGGRIDGAAGRAIGKERIQALRDPLCSLRVLRKLSRIAIELPVELNQRLKTFPRLKLAPLRRGEFARSSGSSRRHRCAMNETTSRPPR